MEETPAKICGGRVLEMGGRDQVVVRGAGVESVLHTVRIATITHAGASGMILEPVCSLGRASVCLRADLEGVPSLATLTLRFRGVDFEGVFCKARGVGAGLEGVRPPTDALVGVFWAEAVREGVPGAEPLADRLTPVELAVSDRSKNE